MDDSMTREQLICDAFRLAVGCYYLAMFLLLAGACVAVAWLAPAHWSVLEVLR